ncbi:hypothetical protein K431DRAFT_294542 [Polychaeton citri CBS 116435]|uniref:Uncharacterized protein n=1 Tax=Polychaeton citri CBS 116435 TaxID=1314669 RepID=A0A9P4UPR7_9PEZI|nr:hypothetical protein K431DRAFT_294542 [Polychaeton citri CBS 116435]
MTTPVVLVSSPPLPPHPSTTNSSHNPASSTRTSILTCLLNCNSQTPAELPSVDSYSFASILASIATPGDPVEGENGKAAEFSAAIEGIATLCARSNMALADEYAAHLPPMGEITLEGAREYASNLSDHSSTGGAVQGRGGACRGGGTVRRRLTTVIEGGSSCSGSSDSGSKSRTAGRGRGGKEARGKNGSGVWGLRWREALRQSTPKIGNDVVVEREEASIPFLRAAAPVTPVRAEISAQTATAHRRDLEQQSDEATTTLKSLLERRAAVQ